MYKKPNILLSTVVLITALNSYADQRVIDGFIQANCQEKIVSQPSHQDKQPGLFSKISQKIMPIVNKITPKSVLEYRKNKRQRIFSP